MILKDVKKNKVKTVFIITFFFMLIAIFIYFLSLWLFEDVYIAVIFGIIASFLTSFISYYNSDKIILSLNNARVATNEEYLQLNLILEGLCIAANLPKPKLYVIDDPALNAFATGRNPKHAVICVTKGLLEMMDKNELEGVLAHELSHIKNYDILVSTISVVMVGFIVILSDAFSRGFLRSSDRDDDNKASGILMLIGLVFIILSPIFAKLLELAISRNREYLADSNAVELTRNNQGLISALEKLENNNKPMRKVNQSTASLFIVNPIKNKKEKDNIWSTHPNTKNRIECLRNIS